MRPLIYLITGPTATGKTELSLKLAALLPQAEIISADSTQVYRGMDIGTAKLPLCQRHTPPHHLIDIVDLDTPFTVLDFYLEAYKAIEQILARNGTPIIVGGSAFYIDTLLYGPPKGPPSDLAIRRELEEELSQVGVDVLYARLQDLDARYAASITCRDRHKIIRGLEIIAITGVPVSSFPWQERPLNPNYTFSCWCITRDRSHLKERIAQRCQEMVEGGLIEEVRELKKRGLNENLAARQAIGYRHLIEEPLPPDFLETFIRDSCRLVKKQLAWFKKNPHLNWLNLDHLSLEEAIQQILHA